MSAETGLYYKVPFCANDIIVRNGTYSDSKYQITKFPEFYLPSIAFSDIYNYKFKRLFSIYTSQGKAKQSVMYIGAVLNEVINPMTTERRIEALDLFMESIEPEELDKKRTFHIFSDGIINVNYSTAEIDYYYLFYLIKHLLKNGFYAVPAFELNPTTPLLFLGEHPVTKFDTLTTTKYLELLTSNYQLEFADFLLSFLSRKSLPKTKIQQAPLRTTYDDIFAQFSMPKLRLQIKKTQLHPTKRKEVSLPKSPKGKLKQSPIDLTNEWTFVPTTIMSLYLDIDKKWNLQTFGDSPLQLHEYLCQTTQHKETSSKYSFLISTKVENVKKNGSEEQKFILNSFISAPINSDENFAALLHSYGKYKSQDIDDLIVTFAIASIKQLFNKKPEPPFYGLICDKLKLVHDRVNIETNWETICVTLFADEATVYGWLCFIGFCCKNLTSGYQSVASSQLPLFNPGSLLMCKLFYSEIQNQQAIDFIDKLITKRKNNKYHEKEEEKHQKKILPSSTSNTGKVEV